jgi:hypothetical protein
MLLKGPKGSNFIEFYKINSVMVAKAARKKEIQIFHTALDPCRTCSIVRPEVANPKVRTRPTAVTPVIGPAPREVVATSPMSIVDKIP